MGVAGAATPPADGSDVTRMWVEHLTGRQHWIRGAQTSSAVDLARQWRESGASNHAVDDFLAAELGHKESLTTVFRLGGRVALGDYAPQGIGGDREPGFLSPRVRMDGRAYWRTFEAMVAQDLGVDADSELGLYTATPLAWAGMNTDRWRIGLGAEDRWIGPGRFGGLMLTDNARPAPLASVVWRPRSEPVGRFRVEAGAGVLDAGRTDVNRPGWLLMDVRWAPAPQVELGATRMAIFGGEGRPFPEFSQLLVPTDPHVYGDPEQLLPDQDEIAALDAKIRLPVGDSLPIDAVALWGQYGGEDVIARELGPIPVPSLAGIANLWGGEVVSGPWSVSIEWARVMDDTFRWYTGHRIYHSGFTQLGESMGHPRGGDSRTWDASLRWLGERHGFEVGVHDGLTVGAIDVAQGRLRTLMADEANRELRIQGWWNDGDGWWNGGLTGQRIVNRGFVPGRDEWAWRIAIGR